MKTFGLKDLNRNFIEFTKLIGMLGIPDFEEFLVGNLVLPHKTEGVYDVNALTKAHNLKIFKTKPNFPYYLLKDVKDIILEFDKKPVDGIYINHRREIQRVYNMEKVLEKNNFPILSEKEFILNRFFPYLKEDDLSYFPKKYTSNNYIEVYGYKKQGNGFEKVFQFSSDFIGKLKINKDDIKTSDHVCHISDLPILKSWMNKRKVKYANMKTIRGITQDWYIVFDLKEKEWHKIRIKLTTEPPSYLKPYIR